MKGTQVPVRLSNELKTVTWANAKKKPKEQSLTDARHQGRSPDHMTDR